MSMRSEFEKIIASWGHWILLQRVLPTTPATYSKLEPHKTRHVGPSSLTLAGLSQEHPEGVLSTSERVYYFKRAVNPFEGDRIYEGDPRAPQHQTVWEIDVALPLRGDDGNISFWTVGATRIRPN